MNKYNLKVGDKLTAIDVCKMSTGEEAMMIYKEYPIVSLTIEDIVIETKISKKHYFPISELHKYFDMTPYLSTQSEDTPTTPQVAIQVTTSFGQWTSKYYDENSEDGNNIEKIYKEIYNHEPDTILFKDDKGFSHTFLSDLLRKSVVSLLRR